MELVGPKIYKYFYKTQQLFIVFKFYSIPSSCHTKGRLQLQLP